MIRKESWIHKNPVLTTIIIVFGMSFIFVYFAFFNTTEEKIEKTIEKTNSQEENIQVSELSLEEKAFLVTEADRKA